MSEIVPHVTTLKSYLVKDKTPDVSLMRASLKEELESCFSLLIEDSNYLIATYPDLRFKVKYLGVVEAERAREKILLEFIKIS